MHAIARLQSAVVVIDNASQVFPATPIVAIPPLVPHVVVLTFPAKQSRQPVATRATAGPDVMTPPRSSQLLQAILENPPYPE